MSNKLSFKELVAQPKKGGPGTLGPSEELWRDRSAWLESKGYRLRARYQPGWVPSWKSNGKMFMQCEDGQGMIHWNIMDAVRISDNKQVTMKLITSEHHPDEVNIWRYLTSEPLASDPHNHCVPLYEVLDVPDQPGRQLLIMPLLRQCTDPRFDKVEEVMDMATQFFEGLQFMHKHGVAHRDCTEYNLMMDAAGMYPEPWHPVDPEMKADYSGPVTHLPRTGHPVRYYLIDFGLSKQWEPGTKPPLLPPVEAGDKTLPEYRGKGSETPHEPLSADVYYIGNFFREEFLQGCLNFDFMTPLISDMTHKNPAKRPTMDTVVSRWQQITEKIPQKQRNAKVLYAKDHRIRGFFHTLTRTLFSSH